jgi:hypothetical protein
MIPRNFLPKKGRSHPTYSLATEDYSANSGDRRNHQFHLLSQFP